MRSRTFFRRLVRSSSTGPFSLPAEAAVGGAAVKETPISWRSSAAPPYPELLSERGVFLLRAQMTALDGIAATSIDAGKLTATEKFLDGVFGDLEAKTCLVDDLATIVELESLGKRKEMAQSALARAKTVNNTTGLKTEIDSLEARLAKMPGERANAAAPPDIISHTWDENKPASIPRTSGQLIVPKWDSRGLDGGSVPDLVDRYTRQVADMEAEVKRNTDNVVKLEAQEAAAPELIKKTRLRVAQGVRALQEVLAR